MSTAKLSVIIFLPVNCEYIAEKPTPNHQPKKIAHKSWVNPVSLPIHQNGTRSNPLLLYLLHRKSLGLLGNRSSTHRAPHLPLEQRQLNMSILDLKPADTPDYMIPAWLGCISWAAGEPVLLEQFKKDTGLSYSAPKNGMDAMIDEATGHRRKSVRNSSNGPIPTSGGKSNQKKMDTPLTRLAEEIAEKADSGSVLK